MELDSQKILLLRSYSCSVPASKGGTSASGLEKFLPRTSTPSPESFTYVDNSAVFDQYEIFRTWLEKPPQKVTVRGIEPIPYHFITGHLIEIPQKAQKISKFENFKKSVKDFFEKCYLTLTSNNNGNKCDFTSCPMTCECQKIRSLLNKTIVLDCDEGSVED